MSLLRLFNAWGAPQHLLELCEVCGWEDHPGTREDLEFVCGTNGVGLRQARENYLKFGASVEWLVPRVRKPLPDESPST